MGRSPGAKNIKTSPETLRKKVLHDADELLLRYGPLRTKDFLYRETLLSDLLASVETKAYLVFLNGMIKRKQNPLHIIAIDEM